MDDGLTATKAMLSRFPDMAGFLRAKADEDRLLALRAAETISRPVGSAAFVRKIEKKSGRVLQRQKPGRKPREK
jgi:putative transposase